MKNKILFGVLILLLLCTGCGAAGKHENLSTGMDKLDALEYDAALDSFDKALIEGAPKRLIYRGQGIAYMGKMMYEEAVASFEKALSLSNGVVDDMDIDMNYYLAVSYYKQGDVNSAISVYDAIISFNSKQADAYYLRGALKAQQNLFEESVEDFNKVRELAPSNYDRLIDVLRTC